MTRASPPVRPPPPKRESLKFESDDDMSFGDESEDSLDQIIATKTDDTDINHANTEEEEEDNDETPLLPDDKQSSTADLLNLEGTSTTEKEAADQLQSESEAVQDLLGLDSTDAAESIQNSMSVDDKNDDVPPPPQSQLDPFDNNTNDVAPAPAPQSQLDPFGDSPAPILSASMDTTDPVDDTDAEAAEEEETNGHANNTTTTTTADKAQDIRLKLLLSDKYDPDSGLVHLEPTDLALTDALLELQSGQLSNDDFAVLFIEALFERDFENGDDWEVDPGTARELEDDEGGGGDLEGRAFVVKQQARLDTKNNYSVAAAKGQVIVDLEKDEVRMENYSYYVAG